MILLIPPNEHLTFNSPTSLSFVLTFSRVIEENEGIQLIGLHEFRIFSIYDFPRIHQAQRFITIV